MTLSHRKTFFYVFSSPKLISRKNLKLSNDSFWLSKFVKLTHNILKSQKLLKMIVFDTLKLQKLISRKIWAAGFLTQFWGTLVVGWRYLQKQFTSLISNFFSANCLTFQILTMLFLLFSINFDVSLIKNSSKQQHSLLPI